MLIGSDEGDPSLDRDGRSDSIMLVHLNQKRNQAYIISFPRDMYVTIPGHGKNKINAAYEIGGPALVVRTLESLTGSRMDHVAMIDFEGFVSLTEDLDGVTVNNRTAFSSHGYSYPKGRITLSGDRALWFVRERQALPSELDRAENQRNMLNAILTKGLSAEVVADPVRFTKFVANAAKRIKVDNSLTQTEIRSTMLSLRLRPNEPRDDAGTARQGRSGRRSGSAPRRRAPDRRVRQGAQERQDGRVPGQVPAGLIVWYLLARSRWFALSGLPPSHDKKRVVLARSSRQAGAICRLSQTLRPSSLSRGSSCGSHRESGW